MKAKILIGSFLMASTMFSACNDFLEEDPKGKLTAESYFKTQDELNMSLNALYFQVNQSQINTNVLYSQWQGDDITANPGSNKQAVAEIDRFAATDGNKGVIDPWKNYYMLVKAANYVINNAARTPTSEEEINIAIGNAKYWRAYAYFYLVRVWGAIPLNLDNVIDDYTDSPVPVERVYEQIVADLTDAEKVLPTSYKDVPRKMFGVNVFITQQATKATLSAVYMAMAGYPLNKDGYYAKAAAKAKEVIDGVNAGKYEYEMDSEFKQVYSMGNNYNNETVVGINYSPLHDWGQDSQFVNCNIFECLEIGGWGDGWGEISFWKRYPEGPRKDCVYQPKIRLKDGTLVDWWAKDSQGKPIVQDYHPMFSVFSVNVDDKGNDIAAPFDYTLKPSTVMTNDHRHRLIRYSEVLLWYAESSARAGETTALAKECLKKVRARGVEPSLANTVNGVAIDAMNAQQLAEAAYDEHGWEVAGYWCAIVTRRADQFRMNRLKETFDERAANAPIEVAPGITAVEKNVFTNKTWNENLLYLPYPSVDALKNSNLKR